MKKVFVFVVLLLSSVVVIKTTSNDYQDKIFYSEGVQRTFVASAENQDTESIVTEPIVAVLHLRSDFVSKYDRDDLEEDSDVDTFLKQVRAEGKEYYSKRNKELTKNLLNEDYGTIEVSDYAPFASITFSNKSSEEIKDIVNQIAKSKSIIEIGVVNYAEAKPQMADNFERLGFDDYSTYSGYGSYDGTGITIGILEMPEEGGGGIVNANHNNFNGTDLLIQNPANTTSTHATLVASIAGGNNGIAGGSKLLSSELSGLPYNEIEWMLDEGVNVVNLSYGANYSGNYYFLYDSYFDYITRTYFTTFVAAAGNYWHSHLLKVTSPGTAYNVITVGSSSDPITPLGNPGVYYHSCWRESFDTHKPNLIAPGENIDVDVYGYEVSGTSFAAPHVTGIIALMMDRRALLKSHPELVNAIVTANASLDILPSTATNYEYGGCTSAGCIGYEDRFGAGEVRVDDSIDNIYRNRYFEIDDNSDYRDSVKTIGVTLNAGDELTVSLFWLRNVSLNLISQRVLEPLLDLDLRLYDYNGNIVYESYSRDYNNEIFTYNVTQSGSYSIVVYQYGVFDEGGLLDPSDMEVYGAVSYSIE